MKPNPQNKITPSLFADHGKYATRITRVSVLPKCEPLFSEKCTVIEIDDNSAGEFLKVQQQSASTSAENQTILIDLEEWDALKHAIEFMLSELRDSNPKFDEMTSLNTSPSPL